MYTHVSAKLIAQTKSPLDLLHQESNNPKPQVALVQDDRKPQAESPQKIEKQRPARPKRPRKPSSPSPKKAVKQRRTPKGRKRPAAGSCAGST
jgi:hypothetical protein